MNQPPKQHRGPPHNPGVRDLVQNKRRWASPPKAKDARQGFQGWNERGYLPHRDEPYLTQFVTFRLADSFPESLRSEWETLWKIEGDLERRTKLEAYLDKGRGECHLRSPEIAKIVEESFRLFHGTRYDLCAWVLMPNHVHVLFQIEEIPMSEIVGGWKKYTGRLANKILNQTGAFWAEDYFDTFMRNSEHEQKTMRYIENNPTKAKLVLEPRHWPWSSARLRDQFGRLQL